MPQKPMPKNLPRMATQSTILTTSPKTKTKGDGSMPKKRGLQAIGTYAYDPEEETWEVRLDEDSYFSCLTQIEAEILSRLVTIESKLNRGTKQ